MMPNASYVNYAVRAATALLASVISSYNLPHKLKCVNPPYVLSNDGSLILPRQVYWLKQKRMLTDPGLTVSVFTLPLL